MARVLHVYQTPSSPATLSISNIIFSILFMHVRHPSKWIKSPERVQKRIITNQPPPSLHRVNTSPPAAEFPSGMSHLAIFSRTGKLQNTLPNAPPIQSRFRATVGLQMEGSLAQVSHIRTVLMSR